MKRTDLVNWKPQPGDALLIIDVQNDFLPGGNLSVPHGNKVIPELNHYLSIFTTLHLPVYATRDWHPAQHCSFYEQGGNWPAHCIAGTYGAKFASALALPASTLVTSKATSPDADAYSGFQDTSLNASLQERNIRRLFIGGLATEYCVFNTVCDALQFSYYVFLLVDAIRPVDVHPGDGQRALDKMKNLGAQFTTLEQLAL